MHSQREKLASQGVSKRVVTPVVLVDAPPEWKPEQPRVRSDVPPERELERRYVRMFPPKRKTRTKVRWHVPPERKTGTRVHSAKPPFYETALLFLSTHNWGSCHFLKVGCSKCVFSTQIPGGEGLFGVFCDPCPKLGPGSISQTGIGGRTCLKMKPRPSAWKRLQMKIWRFYFAFTFVMERQINFPRFLLPLLFQKHAPFVGPDSFRNAHTPQIWMTYTSHSYLTHGVHRNFDFCDCDCEFTSQAGNR